jgi:hypothetical protein
MMTTTSDRQARISADIILLILLALIIGPPLAAIRIPTSASAEMLPLATARPPLIVVITATPALPTPRPTEALAPVVNAEPATAIPTDPPAPVVQIDPPTAEPVIVYVPVVIPTDTPPTPEVREVAPGIEHGTRLSQRGPNTAGPGMPEATPEP